LHTTMKKNLMNVVLAFLLLLSACRSKEKIGPSLEELVGPVEFEEQFTVSTLAPDFAAGEKVYFNAKFKKDVSWVLTLTGTNSSAVKKFTGSGRAISLPNVQWDGTADALPSFRAEQVVATLSFPMASSVPSGYPLSYNIAVGTTKNLNAGHVLVTDFSVNKIVNVFNGNFDAVPADRWPSNFGPTTLENDAPLRNPDGNSYCMIGPLATWQDNADFPGHISPYVDHLLITATSVGYPVYFPLIADPTKIFFNIMVYNTGSPYTWLEVTLHEEHPHIADSVINKSINIRPNWSGWKLVTHSYSDFKTSDTTQVLNNPQKIRGMQLTLLSAAPQDLLDAKTEEVSVAVDHIIFSHYKPYQP
jgi:hypothetical protein